MSGGSPTITQYQRSSAFICGFKLFVTSSADARPMRLIGDSGKWTTTTMEGDERVRIQIASIDRQGLQTKNERNRR